MSKELHAFIVWENARKDIQKIVEQIEKEFKICKIYEISWPKERFVKNLKRFYGITLANPEEKKSKCGDGPFLLIVLNDMNPTYGKRKTSLGSQNVNTNIYDFKMKTRRLLGSGFILHSSIHKKEANHDFTMLLGKNLDELAMELNQDWDEQIERKKIDLYGNEWSNPKEVFKLLNATVNYVVLRNFENFPDDLISSDHVDVDLLTDEKFQMPFILNMEKENDENIGYKPVIKINNKKIKFDIKHIEDGYYDKKWSKNILKNKVMIDKGFFVPSDEDYFYSLLYHMLIHKNKIRKDYCDRLFNIIPNTLKHEFTRADFDDFKKLDGILNQFMKKHGYRKTNSAAYTLRNNEISRLVKVGMYTAKHEGWNFLFRAIKFKIKKIMVK